MAFSLFDNLRPMDAQGRFVESKPCKGVLELDAPIYKIGDIVTIFPKNEPCTICMIKWSKRLSVWCYGVEGKNFLYPEYYVLSFTKK